MRTRGLDAELLRPLDWLVGGDTLNVDTIGYNEAFWLDRRGLPHTEALHTLEKFTRMNQAQVKYQVTVDDPGAYTAPWTTSSTCAARTARSSSNTCASRRTMRAS